MSDPCDPMSGCDTGQVIIDWATPDSLVAARNVLAKNSNSPEELSEWADMLGYNTKIMKERYNQGVIARRGESRRKAS